MRSLVRAAACVWLQVLRKYGLLGEDGVDALEALGEAVQLAKLSAGEPCTRWRCLPSLDGYSPFNTLPSSAIFMSKWRLMPCFKTEHQLLECAVGCTAAEEDLLGDVPDDFLDPVTFELMTDPVLLPRGCAPPPCWPQCLLWPCAAKQFWRFIINWLH